MGNDSCGMAFRTLECPWPSSGHKPFSLENNGEWMPELLPGPGVPWWGLWGSWADYTVILWAHRKWTCFENDLWKACHCPPGRSLNTSFKCLNGKASVLLTHLSLLHCMLTYFPYLKANVNLCAPQDVREESWKQVRLLGAERLGWNSGVMEDK